MSDPSAAQPAGPMRYTKTFKKYTSEADEAVLTYVREWAREEGVALYEDASIVKVTTDRERVESLLESLREHFDYIPPEARKDDAKK